jgi:DNA-binding response OmpR family regulator
MTIHDRGRALRVLLAGGNRQDRELLAGGLTREGLRVFTATTADEVLRRYRTDQPDAVLMDADAAGTDDAAVNAADGVRGAHQVTAETAQEREALLDTFALCRLVRERGGRRVAVLLVGRRQDDPYVVAAYEAGADSYAVLPASPEHLALRLRALVDRYASAARETWDGQDGRDGRGSPRLERLAGWELNHDTHEARRVDAGSEKVRGAGSGESAGLQGGTDDEPVALTPAEFRLLHVLAANAGRTLPEERLQAHANVARVRQQISRLRHKLGLPTRGAGAIEAHDRLGYRLMPAVQSHAGAGERSAQVAGPELHGD